MTTDILETRLSFGDELAGRVVLRGCDLVQLALSWSYEDVAALLWRDVVRVEPGSGVLGAERLAAFDRLTPLAAPLAGRDAAEAMRMMVAAIPPDCPNTPLSAVAHVGIAAALAIHAQSGDAQSGGAPSRPDPDAGHTTDILRIATGRVPTAAEATAFERYCILMMDHGISASTYCARIAASTGAATVDAVIAALSTLQGPRHGGAPAFVLDQLDAIGGPENVPQFVADQRAAGGRIIGFGSRAYRGRDVRADLMQREWLAAGGARGARSSAVAIEQALTEELAKLSPQRGLRANVEYYAALLMEAVGVPRYGMTPMFAAARSPGWIAHIAEQRESNRIIRPQSRYTGVAIEAG